MSRVKQRVGAAETALVVLAGLAELRCYADQDGCGADGADFRDRPALEDGTELPKSSVMQVVLDLGWEAPVEV